MKVKEVAAKISALDITGVLNDKGKVGITILKAIIDAKLNAQLTNVQKAYNVIFSFSEAQVKKLLDSSKYANENITFSLSGSSIIKIIRMTAKVEAHLEQITRVGTFLENKIINPIFAKKDDEDEF